MWEALRGSGVLLAVRLSGPKLLCILAGIKGVYHWEVRVRSNKSTFLAAFEYFFPLPDQSANGCIAHTQVLCDLSLGVSAISVCSMDGFDTCPGESISFQAGLSANRCI